MAIRPAALVVPGVVALFAWLATRRASGASGGVTWSTPPGSAPGALPAPSGGGTPSGGSGGGATRQLPPPRATAQPVVRHRIGNPLVDRTIPPVDSQRRVPRSEVAKYQQELDALGYAVYRGERTDRGNVVPYYLETDGVWSLLWANALLRFQEDTGLYPDGGARPGELDAVTMDAIDFAYHEHVTGS